MLARGSRTLYTNRLDSGCHPGPQKAKGEGTASENSGEKARLGASGPLPFQLSAHSFLEKRHRLIIAKSLTSGFPPGSHGELSPSVMPLGVLGTWPGPTRAA